MKKLPLILSLMFVKADRDLMKSTSGWVRMLALSCMLGALFALALPIAAFGQTTAEDFSSRGRVKEVKGDLDGAIADYSRSIELNPQNANAYNSRGLAKQAKGDLDGAIADFNRVIELAPRGNVISYNNRGLAKQAKGDLDGAIADFNRAIELDPEYADAYNNRGKAKQAKGDLEGAKADYNRAGILGREQAGLEVADPHSPDGRFSVDVEDNPAGHETDLTDKVIVLRVGEKVIAKKISGGNSWLADWDKAGKYVAVCNREGSAGGDTWVFRLSDGKCIGSVITDSDLVEKATEAMKRLDSRITEKKLLKRIVAFNGWTKEGVLKFEVYTRYLTRESENEGKSHGEEAQFTYHGNMKVEGSKLVSVGGKAEEGPW
jgi:tetratricopeptide (TPR) repeat protein